MQLLLDKEFEDLDMLTDEVRDWDLDFRLLQLGGFSGRIRQIAAPDVLVSYARFHSKLNQLGSTPVGYRTFVIPADEQVSFWWLGYNVNADDLLIFSESRELASTSQGYFEIYTVSLSESRLETLLHSLQLPRLQPFAHLHKLEPETAMSLRKAAKRALQASSPAATDDLAEKIVASTGTAGGRGKPGSLRRRDQAIMRIAEFLHDMPEARIGIADMCRLANVSERTLQYAFMERYGIPPNAFVKRWKLNTARRLLLDNNPGNITVGEIAAQLGFYHQSQFTADYRKLFSELPSQTLARAK